MTVLTFYVAGPTYVFMVLQRRVAVGFILLNMGSAAVALALTDGVHARAQQWLIVVCAAIGTAVLVGMIIRRTDEATRAERAAKAELADLNAHLEQRVAEQVDELERTGRLRRFLAPQVADVVVSQGSDVLLEPHSRDVVVLFCDLRGFTRFTNATQPDVVMRVLAEYYAAVGTELEAHGATIGGYDGDGIMAYLGDPIVRPDAAPAAIAMAHAIGRRLDAVVERWRGDGHDLGFGIGLAFGPATLGVVGFDGRFDYTALGAVVNLAARLCADASAGEIVVDDALRRAASVTELRPRGQVALKGFDDPVATYALLR
jgi:adenylate cyclase